MHTSESGPSWQWRDDRCEASRGSIDLNGIPTAIEIAPERCPAVQAHPNGATSLYSIVVTTPRFRETIDAFVGAVALTCDMKTW